MTLKIKKKKSLSIAVIAVILVIIGAVSVWSYLSRQANKEKTFNGAKFISMDAGVEFKELDKNGQYIFSI